MSTEIQAKVYGWIENQQRSSTPATPLREIVLSHLNAADQLQQLARFQLAGADLADIKTQLYRTAVDVVAAWRHFQRFAIQSFFGDSTAPAAYYPFALADEAAAAIGPEPSEPASMQGVLRMQMRHNEILAKINAGIMLDQTNLLVRQNEKAYQELDAIRARYSALLAASEEAMERRRAVALEEMKAQSAEARMNKLTDSVLSALPVIGNGISQHFGGPRLLPEGLSIKDLLLEQLRKNLNDESVDRVLAALPSDAARLAMLELLFGRGKPSAPAPASNGEASSNEPH